MKRAVHWVRSLSDEGRDALFIAAVAACLLVPLAGLVLYHSVTLPSDPLAAFTERREQLAAEEARLTHLDTLRQAVAEDPRNGQKWLALGRAYMENNAFERAQQAFENAAQVSGRSVESLAGLAEALVREDNGQVSAKAKTLLEEIQNKSPDIPPILFYLGVAAEQERQYEQMTEYWRRLVEVSPKNTPWLPAIRQRINELASRENLVLGELLARSGLPPQ